MLRDEAYRLDGSWMGAMAYLDDEGNPVVFEERAEFIQVGMDIQGVVRSQRVCALPKHETLEYRVSFSIAKHGYAGGVWSESIAARKYFGVMLGHFEEDSSILAGTWMGTHRNGVRRGFFKWRNTHRDGEEINVEFNFDHVADALVASFSPDRLCGYNDCCRVTH